MEAGYVDTYREREKREREREKGRGVFVCLFVHAEINRHRDR